MRPPAPRRLRLAPLGAVASVLVGAVVAAAVVRRSEPLVVTPAAPSTTVGSPGPGAGPRPGTGHVPGRAVVVDHNELATFDASGRPTGSRRLDPLKDVLAISSDLDGGWVACGRRTDAPLTRELIERLLANPQEGSVPDECRPTMVWYPTGGAPVVVEGGGAVCFLGSITVVDSPLGATVVYPEQVAPTARFRARVLATGDDRLVLDGSTDPSLQRGIFGWWTASPGRLLVDTGGTAGLRLYDLATGGQLPLPAIDESAFPAVAALAPDGSSLAVVSASDGLVEPTELIVYDLTTGTIRHRQRLDLTIHHAQISYDGTTVAVGTTDPASPAKVTTVDLSAGTHHELDVHGLLV